MGRLHEDMSVFISDSGGEQATWQVLLHAPEGKGLLYDGGSWRILVDFPPTYPETAPALFFGARAIISLLCLTRLC
jgi:ubiquitin-protein ligase